jgi:hypothetical protein
MEDKIFISLDNLHKITIKIESLSESPDSRRNCNFCWFNIDTFNPKNCKTFIMLIKEVIDFISSKNIINIKQYVYSDDCSYFKKSQISNYMEDNNSIFIIDTKIEDFIEEIVNVFDIKKI